MSKARSPERQRPLDACSLDALAVNYLARYLTTRARLGAYLSRKLRERGWEEPSDESADAVLARVIERCQANGYVDDAAYAESRASALRRRGYGPRRVRSALLAAGVAHETARLTEASPENDFAAAEAFARRKKIGRFGDPNTDPLIRRRQFAAMVRAGHSFDLVKFFAGAGHYDGDIDV